MKKMEILRFTLKVLPDSILVGIITGQIFLWILNVYFGRDINQQVLNLAIATGFLAISKKIGHLANYP